MGWWKVRNRPLPKPTKGFRCINAIPGKDHVEDYYNGDGPCDWIFFTTEDLVETLGVGHKYDLHKYCSLQDYKNLFLSEKIPAVFKDFPKVKKIAKKSKNGIIKCYQESWKRNPYREEWDSILKTVDHLFDEEWIKKKIFEDEEEERLLAQCRMIAKKMGHIEDRYYVYEDNVIRIEKLIEKQQVDFEVYKKDGYGVWEVTWELRVFNRSEGPSAARKIDVRGHGWVYGKSFFKLTGHIDKIFGEINASQ